LSILQKIAVSGFAGTLLGGGLYIYAAYFFPSSGGYGGAGMAGLPAAFTMIAAFGLMGVGALVLLICLIVFLAT
jgi:hypothetical protein